MSGLFIHPAVHLSIEEKEFLGESKGKVLLYVNIDEFHSINRH
jgi:hypothetical protein